MFFSSAKKEIVCTVHIQNVLHLCKEIVCTVHIQNVLLLCKERNCLYSTYPKCSSPLQRKKLSVQYISKMFFSSAKKEIVCTVHIHNVLLLCKERNCLYSTYPKCFSPLQRKKLSVQYISKMFLSSAKKENSLCSPVVIISR